MPKFSEGSRRRLLTCASPIIHICSNIIVHFDFTVLSGYRTESQQNYLYEQGKSQLKWPDSNHNEHPSRAIDIAPWINGTIPWNDAQAFHVLAGAMLYEARKCRVDLRWGGDWDSDGLGSDNKFDDLGHFELV